MPMPWTYRHSQKEFKAFLADARDQMGLVSDNNTYTAVEAVLHVFRARLTPQQVIDFAQILPCTLRSILVQTWQIPANPATWESRAVLVQEVKRHRQAHNLAPDNAIEATAYALRRVVRQRDLDGLLDRIGPDAQAFWHVTVEDPAELDQRIL